MASANGTCAEVPRTRSADGKTPQVGIGRVTPSGTPSTIHSRSWPEMPSGSPARASQACMSEPWMGDVAPHSERGRSSGPAS
eukprot:5187622-Heterocapsa_arctica.AAC.1